MKIEDVTGCLLADKHGLCLAGELFYRTIKMNSSKFVNVFFFNFYNFKCEMLRWLSETMSSCFSLGSGTVCTFLPPCGVLAGLFLGASQHC